MKVSKLVKGTVYDCWNYNGERTYWPSQYLGRKKATAAVLSKFSVNDGSFLEGKFYYHFFYLDGGGELMFHREHVEGCVDGVCTG